MAQKGTYVYEWPKADLTVDNVVLGYGPDGLSVLLIRRGDDPFQGCWALPGGFVEMDESLSAAALRELGEETGFKGLSVEHLEQIGAFGNPGRDPRGRVVSVAFIALVRPSEVKGGDDAAEAAWFRLSDLPPLAFDHDVIIATAIARLRTRIRLAPIGLGLLPPEFAISELQRLYEDILGRRLNKNTFRSKIKAMDILVPTGAKRRGVSHRPMALYRFDADRYRSLLESGIPFEL